jgi:multiple sugar transport system ATP-binding protein
MDEPLSNLDAKLRVQTRTQIASLQRRLGVTTVYVTHDQVEAMTMGDRVAVLKDGVLQQVDTPRTLYDRPANVFVAGFIGSPAMNLVQLPIVDGGVQFGDAVLPISSDILSKASTKRVTVGIRPEKLSVENQGLVVDVDVVEELGSDGFLYGRAQLDGTEQNVVVRVDAINHPKAGDRIHLLADASSVHVFDAETGLRLN